MKNLWTTDQKGGAIPGRLALFEPSMVMRDYHLEFVGQIDKKAMGWVVRAADFDHYYVVKLVNTGTRDASRVSVVRYGVTLGNEGAKKQTPFPPAVAADTVYRIAMDITGNNAVLIIQGSVVDSWSLEDFKQGGVGFFSDKGEQSRIQSLHLTYQVDTLGRVAAWLVH